MIIINNDITSNNNDNDNDNNINSNNNNNNNNDDDTRKPPRGVRDPDPAPGADHPKLCPFKRKRLRKKHHKLCSSGVRATFRVVNEQTYLSIYLEREISFSLSLYIYIYTHIYM